jgi:hypothetical protein
MLAFISINAAILAVLLITMGSPLSVDAHRRDEEEESGMSKNWPKHNHYVGPSHTPHSRQYENPHGSFKYQSKPYKPEGTDSPQQLQFESKIVGGTDAGIGGKSTGFDVCRP